MLARTDYSRGLNVVIAIMGLFDSMETLIRIHLACYTKRAV